MQNRFGFKDFVLLVLVLAVGISVWLSMYQEDRRFELVRKVESQLSTLERQQSIVQRTIDDAKLGNTVRRFDALDDRLSAIEQKLEDGVVAVAPGAGGATRRTTPSASGSRDESWAVPGVPIAWQPELVHGSDPTAAPDFSAGGRFTELFNAQPATIVPLIYKDVYGAWVFERITEYLAEWNPATLELRGVLAGAWQYAPDGTWLRVRIRENARFSDGEPVTAEDVIWTFNWMRNPQVQAERARSITDFIVSLTAIDEKTVEFKFNQVLFTNVSAAMGSFPILPKHFYEKFTPTQFNQATGLVMGSGPFKFATLDPDRQWTPGTDIVLVRNEQYWGPRPVYDELRFRAVRDDLARLTSFNNGDADLTQPSPIQFRRLSEDAEWLKTNSAHSWYNIRGGYNFIGWNTGLRNGRPTVFADKRVRRAMTMMLDRDLIARQFFEGNARVATGPFNRETAQADPTIKPWPYDLEAAGELLDEAGWTLKPGASVRTNERGQELAWEFTSATGSEVTEKLTKYAKDQAAKLGIRVTLRTMDWSVFMKAVDDRDYDAMTMGWSPSSPESDPQQIWHSRYIENQGDNFVQWKNEEADRLIEAGRQELDQAERMKYWHRLHRVIHEEQPYTFLVERPWLRVINRRVGNFVEYKNGFQYDELFIKSGGTGAARPQN